jgi:hypothetical protein
MGHQPTVFVVQTNPNINIIPASRYGDIEILIPEGRQIFDDAFPTVARMKGSLSKYTTDDYILPLGDPAASAIAVMLASEATGGIVTLLKWDRQDKVYYPVRINLHERESSGSVQW